MGLLLNNPIIQYIQKQANPTQDNLIQSNREATKKQQEEAASTNNPGMEQK